MPDNSAQINSNGQSPQRAEGDAGSVEQVPIPHQIMADQYAAQAAAASNRRRGLRFSKLLPSGPMSDDGGTRQGSPGFDSPVGF